MAFIAWNNTSYNTARADILARASQGLGYDYDGRYGYQCWDLGANWYAQVGKSFQTKNSYTGTGSDEDVAVATTWTYQPAFNNNSASPYMAITDVTQIKRGDMIIWQPYTAGTGSSGHNAFADEDYNNGKSYLSCLGQNQGGNWGPNGHFPTINDIDKYGILGAFRYKPWFDNPDPDPPTPPDPNLPIPHNYPKPFDSNIVILRRACRKRKGVL